MFLVKRKLGKALKVRKLAIFVEGYTELLFFDRLVSEIAGAHQIHIEQHQIRGGATVKRTVFVLRPRDANVEKAFYVLIVDCGSDTQVKTRILEEHAGLSKDGYDKIIGIRDVRPSFTRQEIPQLQLGLRKYIKTSLIPVEFYLSVMEIEAWFLAEVTHFPKIDPAITVPAISVALGFDPEHEDMSLRDEPAVDLHGSYQLAGKTYASSADIVATISAIDYSCVYLDLKDRIPYLADFCQSMDSFLSPIVGQEQVG